MLTKYPNEILFKPSTDVEMKEGKEIEKLLRKSFEEDITWGVCVGLAAPQIGINKNVFLALGMIYFNPKIVWYSSEWATFKEGCYSLPDNTSYEVRRALKIRMEWQNKKGEHKSGMFTGFTAEVLQHEFDHLQGKLCCGDKVPDEKA